MVTKMMPEKKNRLIVLVPDCLAGNLELAHKVNWMANRDHCDILYLALVDDDEKMLSVSRCLDSMKTVTSGNALVIHSKLAETGLWLSTLRKIYQPGDQIVCHEEQSVKKGFLRTVPVAQFLKDVMGAPVITISGFYHPQQVQVNQFVHSLGLWLGFLVILAGFTGLEIRLDQALQGLTGEVLLSILVIIEIGAIWAWDSITSH